MVTPPALRRAQPQGGADTAATFLPKEQTEGLICHDFWCPPDLSSGHIPAQ